MSNPLDDSGLPQQPLLQHMQELRRRLIWAVAAWMGASVVSYLFVADLYQVLAAPLRHAFTEGAHRRLMYTGLTEAFVVYIKTALWAGFILSLPVFLYQVWAFIAPGLYDLEKRIVRGFFMAAPLLFFCGILLAYFGVIPLAWRFFLSFEQTADGLPIMLDAKMDDYFGLILQILLAFGLAFLLPLILAILIYRDVITLEALRQYRRHIFVGILAVAAVLTPPDVISQIALALPLWGLFEATLWVSHRLKKQQKTTKEGASL